MGNSLPKYLLKAEQVKLKLFEGIFSIIIMSINEPNNNEEEYQSYDANIKLYRGILDIDCPEFSKTITIDKNIALVDKSDSKMTITLCITSEKMIWRFKAKSLKSYFIFSNTISLSRIPTWSISPICQVCTFGINSKNSKNCGSCGIMICKYCLAEESFKIVPDMKPVKVCKNCEEVIMEQINLADQFLNQRLFRLGSGY
ncbi:hypothetical protein SteCoe_29501 [Stentor coeruleus]|uniref:FYVE-type domain-containing protein n=1 Tax=Stentor coeruleus TaxID=5963 RepID=A0A1R2B5T2_9CILI|nr:hypothetical protein SteCoe_29501 [Stentor coeruleus]